MKPRTLKTKTFAGFILCLLLLLLATPPAPSQTGGAQQPAAGRAVTVTLTALDKEGKFVTTLTAEDLRVEEDGAARAVNGLERRSDLPLLLAIGIDNSASQERVIDGMKLTADELVRTMMRAGTDRAAVFSFNSDATLEQGMTADAGKVRDAISRVRLSVPQGYVSAVPIPTSGSAQGTTALWDAVGAVSDDLLSRSFGPGRRALILITDGVDTFSKLKPDDAVKSAIQSGAAVYPIGIGDKDISGVDRGGLEKLAERTGGRAFFPKKVSELPTVFAQLREELMSQYALTFTSPHTQPDASFHKLKLKVVGAEARRRGVEVSYPYGHFAGHAPKQ